jgi:hypothetical protein
LFRARAEQRTNSHKKNNEVYSFHFSGTSRFNLAHRALSCHGTVP